MPAHDPKRVLEYQRQDVRKTRNRPDTFFGSLSIGCLASNCILLIFLVFAGPRFPGLMLWPVAWVTGIVSGILGLVFDRRREWMASAGLVANILFPPFVALVGWILKGLF